MLCEPHHLAHHAGEYAITSLPGQQFRFVSSDGATLPGGPGLHLPVDDAALDEEFGHVEPNAATTRWDGQRLDRHYAVAVLAERRASTTAAT